MPLCGSDRAIVASKTPVIKAGHLNIYADGFFGKSWKQYYFILNKDSLFTWYKDVGKDPVKQLLIKNIANYFVVGPITERIPNRPDIPKKFSSKNFIALPDHPNKYSEINWIICADENELKEWMKAIVSTLPPPPKPQQAKPSAPPGAPQTGQPHHAMAAPPPYSGPSMPQPNHQYPGQQNYRPAGPYPPNHQAPAYQRQPGAPYPQGAQQRPGGTTVVVQGGRRNSGNSLNGFAAGMMMGAMMTPGPFYGCGFGWGFAPYIHSYGGFYHSPDINISNNTTVNNITNTTENTTNNIENNENNINQETNNINQEETGNTGDAVAGEQVGEEQVAGPGDYGGGEYGGYGQGQFGEGGDAGFYGGDQNYGGGYDQGYQGDGGGYDQGYQGDAGGYDQGYQGDGGYYDDGGCYDDGGYDDYDDGGGFDGGDFDGGDFGGDF